jgi:alpha-beta hydrolase superfamily lysophospholipase
MIEKEVSFHASDGILKGTLRIPTEKITKMSLLVHGITVNREEDGFYTELAKRLSSIGTASLRFDLPGHGSSQGSYEKLTLTKVISAIDTAYKEICTNLLPNDFPLSIIASSFGGGLSACWVAKNPNVVRTLILLNPLLEYDRHMLFSKPYWNNGKLTTKGNETLDNQGWLPHGDFRMGKEMINDLLFIKPQKIMQSLKIPVLTIHGDLDSVVSFDAAKKYSATNKNSSFVTIHGADHGFSYPDDTGFTHPDTIKFHNIVFDKVVNWIDKI